MKQIPLTQGKFALVDDEDFDKLSRFKWYCVPTSGQNAFRAVTSLKKKRIFMHRLLLDAPKGMLVDHKNHNGLDNRRENLRLCTHAQNMMNQRMMIDNKSGYKGVVFKSGKFYSRITLNGKKIELGSFKNPKDAATAYDEAAKKYFGEFACTNF